MELTNRLCSRQFAAKAISIQCTSIYNAVASRTTQNRSPMLCQRPDFGGPLKAASNSSKSSEPLILNRIRLVVDLKHHITMILRVVPAKWGSNASLRS